MFSNFYSPSTTHPPPHFISKFYFCLFMYLRFKTQYFISTYISKFCLNKNKIYKRPTWISILFSPIQLWKYQHLFRLRPLSLSFSLALYMFDRQYTNFFLFRTFEQFFLFSFSLYPSFINLLLFRFVLFSFVFCFCYKYKIITYQLCQKFVDWVQGK